MKKVIVVGIILLFLGSSIPTLASPGNHQSHIQTPYTKAESRGYSISLNGTKGNNGWFVSKVRVTIAGLQGNESVFYSLDNSPWQSYQEPILVTNEGNHTYAAVVIDLNRNVTFLNPVMIKIDMTMPFLTYTRYIFLFKIKYIARTDDNMSGMDRVEFWIGPYLQYTYKFDDPSGVQTATWILYPIPHLNITVTIWAIDLAGNIGWYESDGKPICNRQSQNSHSVQQINNLQESQQQEPNTKKASKGYNITLNGTMGNNSWYISNVSIAINGLQGNESVFYSLEDCPWHLYLSPMNVSGDGKHPFTVVIIGKQGNVTLLNPIFVNIDKTPPTATLSEKFRFRNRSYGYWICFEYTVNTHDSASGLDRVEFWDGSSLKYEQNLYHGSGPEVVTWRQHRRINGLTVVVYDLAGNFIRQGF